MIEKLNSIVIGGIKFDNVYSQQAEMQPTNEELMWKQNQIIDKVNELEERLNKLEKKGELKSEDFISSDEITTTVL